MSDFNVFRYGGGNSSQYNDSSDNYANYVDTVLSFQHLPSGISVTFKAFVTAFNETFSCDWAQEQVYGRGDPIPLFKQTRRNVSLAFKVPAASSGEAYENMAKIQQLTQFLYPTYVDVTSAQTISQSPLVRVKIMNLLSKTTTSSDITAGYSSTSDPNAGVIAVIDNLTVNHNLEGDDGVVEVAKNTILPKLFEVTVNFLVIHEHPMGWSADNQFSNPAFPYGAAAPGTVATDVAAAATGGNSQSNANSAADASTVIEDWVQGNELIAAVEEYDIENP